jgi:hypothetical protein
VVAWGKIVSRSAGLDVTPSLWNPACSQKAPGRRSIIVLLAARYLFRRRKLEP